MAYTKKTWEDYPDTSTPITADNLQNIEDGIEILDTDMNNIKNSVNELYDTNFISVGLSSVQTLANQGANKILLNKIISKRGESLTLINNEIKIGQGIDFVLISSSVLFNSESAGTKNIMINKNSEEISRSLNSVLGNAGAGTIAVHASSIIVPVTENDVIILNVFANQNDKINPFSNGTCLTLLAIK